MLQRLSDRVYHTPFDDRTDRPNLGYIKGERFSLMVDCGASPAHVAQYMAAVEAAGLPAPALAVLTHWHWDHSFGMCALSIPVIAGAQSQQKLEEMGAWAWDEAAMEKRLESGAEIPFCHQMLHREYADCRAICLRRADVVFEKTLTLDLGGLTCRLLHVGGPHSQDSVVCHLPEEKLVFIGDSDNKDLYASPMPFDPENPDDYWERMDRVPWDKARLGSYRRWMEGLDFERYVPGHGPPAPAAELFSGLEG